MANDGSIPSLVEAWIVAQLDAIPQLTGKVFAFEGTFADRGNEFVDEMYAQRDTHVVVLFEGDEALELQEGDVAYLPTYSVYAIVKNERGAARNGDGTTPGTNKLRDLIRVALHNKYPAISDSDYGTDDTQFKGSEIIHQRKDGFIQKSTLVVRESPKT